MTPLEIAVIGAGNIGSAMAVLLAKGGAKVTLVARGARAQTVRDTGLTLIAKGTPHCAQVAVTERLERPQDAIFACVKAHDLPAALAQHAGGIGAQTQVVPMVNGMPFWFFADDPDAGAVPCVDPEGTLARLLRPAQVLGAVLLMTVELDAQGRAISNNTPTLSLAPVAEGADAAALGRLARTLRAGGVAVDVPEAIRQKVMVKLLANFATNPLSALTGATLRAMGSDPVQRAIVFGLADEFRALARPLGYALPDNAWLGDLLLDAGDFATSMLQDARAGRRLELDAIVHAPRDMAQARGLTMPLVDAVLDPLSTARALPLGDPGALLRSLSSIASFERTL
ncbi:2-dehydropantoate 2-reductase [Aquimixticola soesokkakensis]|uniref:2-dehydropantoate 2-reductase n=1 Tax=Aquimixticola soesokkakensis TaxID=1519096 RepID=A0A1Y5TAV4_9RHOB|nr:2-dehydropantoate 2-reductase N-terminal domain-containing protein [Aquimixticola soesokkakensis]SLN59781.1 2-dehydropantoate 2-reductase [Aquimixticola soesokkakensis]